MLGLERPWVLASLVLVIGVLWRSWQAGVPAGRLLGTLRFWPDQELSGDHLRRRIPPARWALAGAMVAAIAGLAGPVWNEAQQTAAWTVIVDRSPSMGLPLSEDKSRGQGAWDLARDHLPRGANLIFVAGDAPQDQQEDKGPPSTWAVTLASPEPDWVRFDSEGTIWLTDRKPQVVPRYASLVHSGGHPVPGVVARDSEQELVWDGQREVLRPTRAGPLHVEIVGLGDSHLAALARLWVENRGHRLSAESPALVIEFPRQASAPTEDVQSVAQAGWEWRGFLTEPPRGRPWIFAQPSGSPAVAWSPGRIEVAFFEQGDPGGDLQGLARSFAALCDRALVPGPGVVSALERRGAGEQGVMGPLAVGASQGGPAGSKSSQLQVLLASVAAVCGCLALVLSRGGRL